MNLHSVLPMFVLPLGVGLILLLAGLLCRRRALIWAGVALLWISSLPVVGISPARLMESASVRAPASAAPTVDAIVVLSAGRIIAHAAT